jgi:hypothetical protein
MMKDTPPVLLYKKLHVLLLLQFSLLEILESKRKRARRYLKELFQGERLCFH